jgi:hypothetical protein
MPRMTILAVALCGAAFVATPAGAQNGNGAPTLPVSPPAPNDAPTGSVPPAAKAQPAEAKAPEALIEAPPPNGSTPEARSPETGEGRYTFSRMNGGYVRLDNRTGQVSYCSKRSVGWTCQLAPEDRGVLENEIVRLQEENASLKKELLTHGLSLPGSMKGEAPAAQNERSSSQTGELNVERVRSMVEKAWRRLVDMISTLQKDMMKKS